MHNSILNGPSVVKCVFLALKVRAPTFFITAQH